METFGRPGGKVGRPCHNGGFSSPVSSARVDQGAYRNVHAGCPRLTSGTGEEQVAGLRLLVVNIFDTRKLENNIFK